MNPVRSLNEYNMVSAVYIIVNALVYNAIRFGDLTG